MNRPKLHITPEKNWMNDPNGFIWYKGKYHLFYQHFPYRPVWGTMHWNHLAGDDLAHMTNYGIALYPSKSFDRNGCFSGSAIEIDGKMNIYYTGVRYGKENTDNIHISGGRIIQCQAMLESEDGFNFDNSKKELIIPSFKDWSTGSPYDTRDPKVFKLNNVYYMVLGTKHKGFGRILVYKSDDGKEWEFLCANDDKRLGSMLECPDLYCINRQWIMTLSPENTLNDGENYPSHCQFSLVDFVPETGKITLLTAPQYIDWGLDYYAAQSTEDKDGNRVIIGWMRMPEPVDNWNGILTFPRIIDYVDNHVYYRIHPDIQKEFCINTDKISLDDAYHISMDIDEGGKVDIAGYKIELQGGCIKTDREEVFTNVGTLFGHNANVGKEFCTPAILDKVHLDIYLDRNIIEIYINNGYYVISNVLYNPVEQFIYSGVRNVKIKKAK